jgi:hypothetical protein
VFLVARVESQGKSCRCFVFLAAHVESQGKSCQRCAALCCCCEVGRCAVLLFCWVLVLGLSCLDFAWLALFFWGLNGWAGLRERLGRA